MTTVYSVVNQFKKVKTNIEIDSTAEDVYILHLSHNYVYFIDMPFNCAKLFIE